jgi:hypothetical protein
MKKIYLLIVGLFLAIGLQAQVEKSIENTAGQLNSLLSDEELNTITVLTIKGTLDARDFRTLRDSMPVLAVINMREAHIVAYSGTEGTYYFTNYSANTVPMCAFFNDNIRFNTTLRYIRTPWSATVIDDTAFGNCTALDSVDLSPILESLGPSAFGGCSSLIKIKLPSFLKYMGRGVFSECSSLTSVIIPPNITFIHPQSFIHCSSLKSVEIPSSVGTIEWKAFYGCSSLESLTLPASLVKIGEGAFEGCIHWPGPLVLPANVININDRTFYNCQSLTSVAFPEGLETIGESAFDGCTGLTGTLTLPGSITAIGARAFYNCHGLSGDLILPPLLTAIKTYSFAECSSFTSLTIPAKVNRIDLGAFKNCTALSTITALPTVPAPIQKDLLVFDGVDRSAVSLQVPFGSREAYASADVWKTFNPITENGQGIRLSAHSLTFNAEGGSDSTIRLEANIAWTAVADQEWLSVSPVSGNDSQDLILTASANTGTEARTATIAVMAVGFDPQIITIQQSQMSTTLQITPGSLGKALSAEVKNSITSLTLTGSMDARDFRTIRFGMPLLEVLDISAVTIEAFLDTTYGNHILYPANALPTGTLFGSDFMKTYFALSEHPRLSVLKLPVSLTTISSWSLQDCSHLVSVEIPSGVTTIGREAFARCRALPTITIPSSVTEIGREAFCYCDELVSIELPPLLKTIEESTFNGCRSLLMIDIPDSVTTIKNLVFEFCSSLTSVTIPRSVTYIGYQIFVWCTKLQSIFSYPRIPVDISDPSAMEFEEVDKSTCILYVPFGSKELYASAYGWKDFIHIVEMDGFELSVTDLSMQADASSQSIDITSNTPWSAVSDKEWLTVSPASGDTTQRLTVSVLENGSAERKGAITFTAENGYIQTLQVTQLAMVNNLPVANAGQDQSVEEGQTVQLDGSASSDADNDVLTYEWTAPEGITLSDVTDARPTFTAPSVKQDSALTFKLVVKDGKEQSVSDGVIVTVTNRIIKLEVSLKDTVFDSKESSAKVLISGNAKWSAVSDQDWLSVTPLSGEGEKQITLSAPANGTFSERTAIVTISAPEAEDQTITITQMGLVTAVDPMASSMEFTCYPNPFTSQLAIEIENPSLKEITVEIYSISGQKIKTLAKALKGQKISLVWKGDDELGKQVPPGMYLLKMNGQTMKVVREE